MGSTTVRTHVILPKELVEAVDETVGQRNRSHFIEEAVREKLARARLIEAFDRAAGSLADVDIPGWETPEAASEWVRRSRQLDNERLRQEYKT